MELNPIFAAFGTLSSPALFAGLTALATLLLWQALAPSAPDGLLTRRLDTYLDHVDLTEREEMAKGFSTRALAPLFRRFLRIAGGLLPTRNIERTAQTLTYAGDPGGLSVLDYIGLRLLVATVLGGGYIVFMSMSQPMAIVLRNSILIFGVGYMLPRFWLRSRVKRRQKAIERAIPDALDMLTISVEAGLAFESALLRVSEQWHNALTLEFRRAVGEMHLGASRDEALVHMVERTNVDALRTFVAVLVQSNQLGISIAKVLHAQAHEMRVKRRQRAEELARQASVKMVVVLAIFVFPVIFIVSLGPAIPVLLDTLSMMAEA